MGERAHPESAKGSQGGQCRPTPKSHLEAASGVEPDYGALQAPA